MLFKYRIWYISTILSTYYINSEISMYVHHPNNVTRLGHKSLYISRSPAASSIRVVPRLQSCYSPITLFLKVFELPLLTQKILVPARTKE